MIKEDGMEGRFDSILDNETFFPESFFYQMIGLPETILLTNDVLPYDEKSGRNQGYVMFFTV